MNREWAAKIFIVLGLVAAVSLLPIKACSDTARWKGQVERFQEERQYYLAEQVRLAAELDSLRAEAEAERERRAAAERVTALAQAEARRLRPAVDQQLKALGAEGEQARRLLAAMDTELAGLRAQVQSLTVELDLAYRQVLVVTADRDLLADRLATAEALLAAAPALQVTPPRRLLGVLPHPGDAAIFLLGVATTLVLKP